MSKKQNQKQLEEQLTGKKIHGIYNFLGVPRENKVKIKHVGNIEFLKDTDSVNDEFIERFEIRKSTHGEIYKCNIVDNYLTSKRLQPIYVLCVVFEKAMYSTPLFTVIFKFNIEDDINSEKQLLTSEINGKFSFELKSSDGTDVLTNLSDKYNETGFLGKDRTIEYMKKFIMSDDALEMILKISIEKEKERVEQIKEQMGLCNVDFDVPEPSFSYKQYFENEDEQITEEKSQTVIKKKKKKKKSKPINNNQNIDKID
jgi:hypothetical protein